MKQSDPKSAVVIGAGFAGLTAATTLARSGYSVVLVEQHDQTGGRARVLHEEGFTFDMGPSWYWMPEVAEAFFNKCGRSIYKYLNLIRLDPSYQVVFSKDDHVPLPASFTEIQELFERTEQGAGKQLALFMDQAEFKYRTAMKSYVNRPGLSLTEFCNRDVLLSLCRMDMLQPFSRHARKYFHDKRLLQIVSFPVLFLGATPDRIPALYSMMNYADMKLGTWYPLGGMHQLSKAFTKLAEESGVKIMLKTKVEEMVVDGKNVIGVRTDKGLLPADVVISGADYHHTDQELLPKGMANYSDSYWEKREMAPSCLIYYVGVKRKLPRLQHHNLFFEHDFEQHAGDIYEHAKWPEHPLFYLCCPSKTDDSVAPPGMENLFFLIPTAPGLEDTPAVREHYRNVVLKRTAAFCDTSFEEDIVYCKSYACTDFMADYNAFKGNAYGLANTLRQTALLKPSIRHKKIGNLFYTGQLTVPGPGVPPAILSGQLVAEYVINQKSFRHESTL